MFTFVFALMLGLTQGHLNDLHSSDYRVRESAHKELAQQMSVDLYLHLKGVKLTDTEAKRRLEAILEDYEGRIDYKTYQKAKGRKELIRLQQNYEKRMVVKWMPMPRNYPAYPWVDRMATGYWWNGWEGYRIQNHYLERARKTMGSGCAPYYTDYRLATEMWVFDKVSQGIGHASRGTEKEFIVSMEKLTEQIHKELETMIKDEERYWFRMRAHNPLRFFSVNGQ